MLIDQLGNHLEVVYGALVALVVVLLLTPAAGGMARLLGAVDEPDSRRVHRRPIPRLGGVALFFGIIVPALGFLDLGGETRGLLLGAAVATAVGAIDDFRGLTWWEKLGGQLAAAGIATGFGIWIRHFTFPLLGVHSLPEWAGVPLTLVWIVAIMNMMNLLDGLDGLAAGVCAIAAFTFALIALSLERPQPAIVAAIVFGATLGFLRHNFYPARIFMGDSGALLLGYVLAAVAVQGFLKTTATVALFFPLFVLALPILDTSFVIVRRLKYRQPIYVADRSHFHYRFLERGFTQRQTVLYLYVWATTLAAAALGTRFIPFRAHGHWHLWPTIGAAALGVLAVAASAYMVYLLEIVKLTNRRPHRRQPRQAERKTA